MSLTHSDEQATSADSTLSRMSVILGWMLLAGLVVIGIGWGVFSVSLSNGLIAWTVCTISALAAHVAGEYPKGDHLFGARMALQMLVRTAVPFSVAIWGVKFAEPPLETSLVFYILSFYLVGTFTDVQLHVRRLSEMTAQAEQAK